MLDGWPGAVVVVSHDRAFLERTVTDVVVIDEDHPGTRVPGGYAAWEANRRLRRAPGKATAGERTAPKPSTPVTSPARSTAAPPRRTPSTLRRLLKDADKELAALERRKATLTAELASAGGDRGELARIGTAIADVDAEILAVEERWLELSAELESPG